MSSAGERPDSLATAVATQLFQTQSLIQNLLAEIRESSSTTASLSAELKHLRVNVQTLSNIIRGDDGNPKPLVMEVEVLKHAQLHFDKRITEIHKDIEDQILSLAKNMSEQIGKVSKALEAEEQARRAYEIKQMELAHAKEQQQNQLQHADRQDLRLDSRSRFQSWTTVIIATLSLIGTTLALVLK